MRGALLARKKITLPSEWLRLTGNPLARERLEASFRILQPDDLCEFQGRHLQDMLKEVRDTYLHNIPPFGMAILRRDRPDFDRDLKEVQVALDEFKQVVQKELEEVLARTKKELVELLLVEEEENKVDSNPDPDQQVLFRHRRPEWKRDRIEWKVERAVGDPDQIIRNMTLQCCVKGVTYEMLQNPDFVERAHKAFPGIEELHREWEVLRLGDQEYMVPFRD